MEFFSSWTFIIIMVVVLLCLVGLLLILRNKRDDDKDRHGTYLFHDWIRDGLLTIHLPKTKEAEQARKKIPINAETRH